MKTKKNNVTVVKDIKTFKEEINMKKFMVFILAVAMLITSVSVAPSAAKAATTYSYSVSYSNPITSNGSATFEYVDGAVYYSNAKLTKYQLTQTDVAACSSETDQEICQFFDKWGTLWVVYRNEGLYWFNYEILKKGKLQKWQGASDSEKIYATRLAYDVNESTTTIYEAGSLKYTGFTYVTHYTSGRDLRDYPLPDWYTLYKIINDEDYPTVEPTVAPTTEPTVTPTVEPTVAPTTEPTVTPTVAPTEAPTTEPTVAPTPTCQCGNGGKCTCPDGQCKCKDCKCSPEAPCHTATAAPVETPSNCNPADNNGESGDAIVDDNSNGNSNTGKNGGNGNNSVIIDGDGNTVVIVNPVEVHDDDTINNNDTDVIGDNNNVSSEQSGSDNDGNNVADTTGDGNVEAISQSSAGVTPQAKVATPSTVTGSTVEKATTSSKKKKVHYTVKHTKNYVQLIKHSGDGTCGAIHKVRFLRKKHVCWINNKKYTKVYRVGYTKKSRQITLLKGGKKGYRKVVIVQRGSNQKNWKNRTLKGKYAGISAGSHGLDLRANTKSGKSINLQNKTAIRL